jgi:hypothetical protein
MVMLKAEVGVDNETPRTISVSSTCIDLSRNGAKGHLAISYLSNRTVQELGDRRPMVVETPDCDLKTEVQFPSAHPEDKSLTRPHLLRSPPARCLGGN